MQALLILTLIALLIWLFFQLRAATDRLTGLDLRLGQLEDDLRRLKREHSTPLPIKPTVPGVQPAPPPLPVHVWEAQPETPRVASVSEPIPVVSSPTGATPLASQTPPVFAASVPPITSREATSAAPTPATAQTKPLAGINWERFLGVKLFAWVGGLALFLGVAFFVKYSFENNLISAQMRVAIGFLTGIGLVVGGLMLPRERLAVTVQTLCATGIVILYANSFAAHAYYHLLGSVPTFGLMILVTVAAFVLAIRLDAQVVAILGLLGGFLTPPMLSTGTDNPPGLFGYLALLDAGLVAVAMRKRWHYQIALAAVATALMQAAWALKFFTVGKFPIAMAVFLGFTALFLVAFAVAQRLEHVDRWISAAAGLMPSVALLFALYVLGYPYREVAMKPALFFSFVLLADLGLLTLVCLRDELRLVHVGAGAGVFLIVAVWTGWFLSDELLNWALALYFLFATLHSVLPIMLQRLRPMTMPLWWVHLYPVLALLLIMVPLNKLVALSFFFWPVVLLIDLLAVALAVLTASLVSILAVVVLTALATAQWIFRLPPSPSEVPGMLVIIGGFAIFFTLAAIFAARKLLPKLASGTAAIGVAGPGNLPALTPQLFAQVASLAALLPFLLLTLVIVRLPLANPSAVFGLAALLVILLLGVTRLYDVELLAAVTLLAVLLLEHAWHFKHDVFSRFHTAPVVEAASGHPWISVLWYLGFSAIFLIFPFLFQRYLTKSVIVWAASALALPLHFPIIYRGVLVALPNFSFAGLVPAALAIPSLLGLVRLIQTVPRESPLRLTQLALFGGATLFFITLVFPIQFERQWITISWALEGAALLWLFHRVPHSGLRLVGVALLVVSFARLALNPWVISEYGRSGRRILNWYLYTYGIVTVCLMAGARLLAPPRERIQGINTPAVLYSLGAVLAFILLNIEIADYFSGTGDRLAFEFSGNLARDMTYSLAWGLYAFALLAIGFKSKNAPTRYAGMGLLIVTLLKLFLHDLWRLGGLYRIGSLIGLAVLLILVSLIYQRFLSGDALKRSAPSAE